MEVIVAKNSGFCFGVKRAVDMVYSQIGHGNIYTFGPVIHNEEVIKDLENKGVKVINSVEEAADVPKGTVIIRAHGVPAHIYREILSLGHKVVDATCPFVLKIHNIVKEAAAKGEFVVIIGDEKHPEVQGIMGAAAGQCAVIDTEEKAEKFIEDNKNKLKKICIVSQTTFNYNKFKYLVEIFQKTTSSSSSPDSKIFAKWRLMPDLSIPNNSAMAFCVSHIVSSFIKALTVTLSSSVLYSTISICFVISVFIISLLSYSR